MTVFVIFAAVLACTLAAPTTSYGSYGIGRTGADTSIVRHIQQTNEDGSYTFGYEAADGSFRMEHRDASGYVKGKYGYIDTFGNLQEFEYVAGTLNGHSVGYQTRSTLLKSSLNAPFPVIRQSVQEQPSNVKANRNDAGRIAATTEAQPTTTATPVYVPTQTVVRIAPQPPSTSYSQPPAVVQAVRLAPPPPPVTSYATVQQQPTVIRSVSSSGKVEQFIRSLQQGYSSNAYGPQQGATSSVLGDGVVIDALRGVII